MYCDLNRTVVFKGPEFAKDIAVEVTEVDRQAYIPLDAIIAREPVCLIEADPDA
jgi:hypothetical protein